MTEPITSKSQMYALLAAGRLGNMTPQYFSIHDWIKSGDADRYGWWGVPVFYSVDEVVAHFRAG